jgi:hypothetical protein
MDMAGVDGIVWHGCDLRKKVILNPLVDLII